MSKDVQSAHGLHQLMRSWLLAEDPYGLNNRIEPTMGTPAPAMAGAPTSPAAPGRGADAVAAAAPALRAQNYGRGAVQRELEKPTPLNVNSEAFQGERNPRAQAWGETAVDRANAPSPTAEVDRTRGQAWGEDAVDKALNPPTGSGSGFWNPGEAADTASAVGQQAVEGALAKKARGKIARGMPMFAPARTTDPNMPHQQTRSRSPGKSEEDDTPTE
jgi:hypothetical protein